MQYQGNIRKFQVSATTLASTLEGSLHYFMLNNQSVQIQNTITKIANDNDNIHRIQVLDNSGKITASSNLLEVGQYHLKSCTHLQQVLDEGKILAPTVNIAGETDEECVSNTDFCVMYPIFNSPECHTCHDEEEKVLGVLDIDIDQSILQEKRRQITSILGLVGGLTFTFIGLATVFTIRLAVLNPLSQRFANMEKERDEQQKLYFTSRLASIGELASGIAHELNNPLTSVIGFSELLLDKDVPEDIKDDLKVINTEFFMIEAHGKGTLTVKSETDGDNIRVSISDDGSGIEQDVLDKIFDPFFTTKDVGKGTGLGLSICHGIISEHGGKISAESKTGQGTIFIIELPELGNSES